MTKHRITDIPRPILKWAGGKDFSSAEIIRNIPSKIGTYFEPFFGGGAVFFALVRAGRIKRAVISDVNRELISMLITVRDHPLDVLRAIDDLNPLEITEESYLRVRESRPKTAWECAARMIFLNKTCFNGLYRVSKSGKFNVGWNKKDRYKPDAANLFAVSEALKPVTILSHDYRSAVDDAERGDVVYFDPTYFPVSKTANFTAYTRNGFTHADQLRLAATFAELASNRVTVLASNADVPIAREIYGSIRGATIHRLKCPRRVNSDGTKRGFVGEILVVANGNKKAAKAAE